MCRANVGRCKVARPSTDKRSMHWPSANTRTYRDATDTQVVAMAMAMERGCGGGSREARAGRGQGSRANPARLHIRFRKGR